MTCPYCGTSNRTARTQQIAAQTPEGWEPPKTWSPPADAPAPSDRPFTYHSRPTDRRGVYLAVGLALVGIVTAIGLSFLRREDAGVITGHRVPMAHVAAASIATSPEELAQALGVSVEDDGLGVRVQLADAPWEHVYFEWDESARDHAYHVLVYSYEPNVDTAAAIPRLHGVLGRRLEPNGEGAFHGPGINVDEGGATVSIQVDATEPDFRPRVRARWDLVRSALFGAPVQIDEATRRDLLGVGHRVSRLSEVPTTMTIDDAQETLSRLFPSVTRDGATFTVTIDHPWYHRADFELANEAGGRIESLRLTPIGTPTQEDEARVAACLTPVLGEPEASVRDHVEGTRSWTWGTVWKNDHVQQIYALTIRIAVDESAPPRPQESLRAILERLESCAPSP